MIEKILETMPEGSVFNKEQLKMLTNLIHFPSQAIKEEIANILMIISPDFDSSSSLMEI